VELWPSAGSTLPLVTPSMVLNTDMGSPTNSAHVYFYSLQTDPGDNYLNKNLSLINRHRVGSDTNLV